MTRRRRSTISPRRAAAVVTVALVASTGAGAIASRAGAPLPDGANASPSAVTAGPAGAAQRSQYDPALTRPAQAAAAQTQDVERETGRKPRAMTDRELAAARQVAADFAVAYATYSFDEAPDEAAARVAQWATPELADQLRRNTGGAAGRETLTERRQTAVASAETVTAQRVDADGVDLLVVVDQEITWRDGSEHRWPSYLIRVVQAADGWRAAALQP